MPEIKSGDLPTAKLRRRVRPPRKHTPVEDRPVVPLHEQEDERELELNKTRALECMDIPGDHASPFPLRENNDDPLDAAIARIAAEMLRAAPEDRGGLGLALAHLVLAQGAE